MLPPGNAIASFLCACGDQGVDRGLQGLSRFNRGPLRWVVPLHWAVWSRLVCIFAYPSGPQVKQHHRGSRLTGSLKQKADVCIPGPAGYLAGAYPPHPPRPPAPQHTATVPSTVSLGKDALGISPQAFVCFLAEGPQGLALLFTSRGQKNIIYSITEQDTGSIVASNFDGFSSCDSNLLWNGFGPYSGKGVLSY